MWMCLPSHLFLSPRGSIFDQKKSDMPKITIYTTPYCPYCLAAKALLNKKGAAFHEIDVSRDPAERQRMMAKTNGRYTVPQIFFDEVPMGGSDEIHDLDRQGKLDPLLVSA